ncbi:YbhB/YbcL family Raf kinase inhibitor-like protein [Kribbella sp. NBC_01505]|uniref:YbhB/YbcL family Raf kinase inhibitor-like protein n=1 Tax=Kribbella sp. NBC_01505 TaxID=2903580 RepID=UPI0038696E87
MRKIWIAAAVLALGLTTAFAASTTAPKADAAQATIPQDLIHKRTDPYRYLPKVPKFDLRSTTVRNGRPLPLDQQSGIFGVPGGKDISPQLTWRGFPAKTKSFVVSMYDPQAPTGSGFWHWVVANVPATTTSLPLGAGTPGSGKLPAGSVQLTGDAGAARYIGGAPPKGSTHDYYITVTALDVASVDVTPTTSGALTGFFISSHTIGRATLVAPTRG